MTLNRRLTALFLIVKRGWMSFAAALGWVNTRVLLTVVYGTIFMAGAVMLKLFGKDPLARKRHGGPSYWIGKERTDDSIERARHQF